MELGLIGIVLVLLAKEAGVPVPVPGDLIVLGAGVAAARGDLDPVVTVLAIIAATIVGGIVQFSLLRGRARRILLGLLGRFGLSSERVEGVAAPLARGGARSIALARVTPGVRITAIPAAALAGIALPRFAAGLATGNALFSGGHYLAGFAFGDVAVGALTAAGPLLLGIGVVVAVVGAIGWWLVGRRRRTALEAALAWADACCPACLALGAVERRVSAG